MPKPADDEVEISVFGPGSGECIVMHLGSGVWVVIDSCVDAGKQPVALNYLGSLGIDPATAVPLVIVTHWHDDHIKGVGEVVRACSSAAVSIPLALLNDEFGELVAAFEDARLGGFNDGLSEIRAVLTRMAVERRQKWAIEGRVLWSASAGALAHGQACEVRSLSPADGQVSNMLKRLAKQMPDHATSMFRAPSSGKNDVSIAAWVSVGSIAALLGADVETTIDKKLGWDAIVAGRGEVESKASVFKVPHHGSATGHHDDVWTKLLAADPICVITPWQRGNGLLPKHVDIARILKHSGNVYVTSTGTLLKAKKRDPAVERTLRDGGYTLTSVEGKLGHVRMRAKVGAPWTVDLFEAAARM